MKNKNKRLSLKNEFFDALKYINESRNYIYFVVLVFVFSLILGIILRVNLSFINDYLSKIVSQTDNLNLAGLISFIMINNIQTAFFGLFLGVFLGIFSLIDTLFNGIIVGYVVGLVADKGHILDLWALFPHGIFELPAIFISLGLGIKLGLFVFSKKPMKSLRERFYSSINTFVFVVVPLLVIAAVIEGVLIFLMK